MATAEDQLHDQLVKCRDHVESGGGNVRLLLTDLLLYLDKSADTDFNHGLTPGTVRAVLNTWRPPRTRSTP